MASPEKLKKLKSEAHALKPVVMIAGKGLSENVLNELEIALSAHELIKVKLAGYERDAKADLIEKMCEHTKSQVVQTIGHVVVLYRINPDKQ